jgi:drug/metabolite transporter (DMT)-like permease
MPGFLPILVLLCASTLWGLTWLPLKHFGGFGLEGPLVTLVAHGSVGLIALPILFVRRRRWTAHWRGMGVIAAAGGVANLTFAWAMVIGDVTRVMVLFYLLPAWGVLGGWFLLGEHIDRQRSSSLVLALLGAFLVLGGASILDAPPGFADLLAVIAGFGLAVCNIAFRKLQTLAIPDKIGMSFVGCLLWAVVLVLAGVGSVPVDVPSVIWLQLSAFGTVWILLATAGTLWAVHHMEAGRSSVLIIMELVTAVGSAAIITGHMPSPIEWSGGVLILASAVLEAWRPSAGPAVHPSACAVERLE